MAPPNDSWPCLRKCVPIISINYHDAGTLLCVETVSTRFIITVYNYERIHAYVLFTKPSQRPNLKQTQSFCVLKVMTMTVQNVTVTANISG